MRLSLLLGLILVGCGASASKPPAATSGKQGGPEASRAVGLVTSKGVTWSCPFPAEADAAKIDEAVVSILLTVNADGVPVAATVLRDAGYGFGDAACACALRKTYTPALDRSGTPIVSSAAVNVRFSRSPAADR